MDLVSDCGYELARPLVQFVRYPGRRLFSDSSHRPTPGLNNGLELDAGMRLKIAPTRSSGGNDP